MDQKADHFGGFFTWIKKPTILVGSSHGSKSRPFWGVLRMDQKADQFRRSFAWVNKLTISGGSSHGSRSEATELRGGGLGGGAPPAFFRGGPGG